MRLHLPGLAVMALVVAACGSPDYYLLPPPAAPVLAAVPSASVAVAEINLPAYAGAIEIATLTETGAVALDETSLWADTPSRALTRHLVAALQQRLRTQVAGEPWPGFDGPGLRVEVIADRMIGTPAGALEFAGQYIIVSPDSGRIVASDRFALTVPPQGGGYTGLLAAHARAIEQLADRIAGSITGRGAA